MCPVPLEFCLRLVLDAFRDFMNASLAIAKKTRRLVNISDSSSICTFYLVIGSEDGIAMKEAQGG